MEFDPVLLSRIQFGFTIAFHILFPSFTIGLASWLFVLEWRWLRTGREDFRMLYRFWVKIFAVSFAMGVVSGIVMSYQFGTNWSRLSEIAGNIMGPVLTYEVVTAFFMEASFLGVMLFGWDRVGRGLHFLATGMVALGTLLSTFWIISANSWMQTPAGYELRDGIFFPVDWWEIIFNPSFVNRLAHMGVAAYLTTAFVVAGIGAWYLWRGQSVAQARIMFSMALWFIAIFAPIQILLGDLQGLNVLEHQPTKLAAVEGHWETREGAPLVLFAIPDETAEANRFEVAIPKLGSVILTHDWNGEIRGLKEWSTDDRPPVAIVFFAFRIMVGIGLLMLGIAVVGAFLRWRDRLFDSRWFALACMAMTPSGFVAVLTGWITAEVGRQPFVVYGLVRTVDAVTPTLTGGTVATSLATFVIVYAIVFGAGTYYILRLIAKGPQLPEPSIRPESVGKKPKRPLSVPDESFGAAE